jgi:hypothetical protein
MKSAKFPMTRLAAAGLLTLAALNASAQPSPQSVVVNRTPASVTPAPAVST